MNDKEPLTHVRRAISIADKEGLDREKELLVEVHNKIVESRQSGVIGE